MKFDFKKHPFNVSAEEVREIQEKLFAEHLEYCRKNSPFYRERLPLGRVTLDDISKLPFTAKPDIALHNRELLAVPPQEVSDISLTSGTTGEPCPISYTKSDLERLAYNDAVGFYTSGMRPGDRVLLTCTIDRCFIAGLAYYGGVVKLGATAIRSGINSVEAHANIIVSQQVTAIVGVPSFLVKLFDWLRAHDLPNPVKRAICIGEPLRRRDMSGNALYERLCNHLNGNVFSTYASSEIATSFNECSHHCGGHPPVDLAIVEIVDDAGNPLPDGEAGEIVVTPLQVTGMPLIRFRTGDVGFKLPGECGCGLHTLRLGPVIGRKSHMLKIKGTLLFPPAINGALDELSEVMEYYVTASGQDLSDVAEITVAGAGTLDLARIAEKIYSRVRVHLPVRQAELAEVRDKIYGHSRKPVRFFDERVK